MAYENNQVDFPSFEALLAGERPRLVRLCAYLTHDLDAAEDLAQETLVEAWRQRHKLVDPEGVNTWLSAIARNVCLRWARKRGREQTRIVLSTHVQDENSINDVAARFDLEVELDRSELAKLLDRAMALLPLETRMVLIHKYVDETPLAEIAARLGTSEGTAAVRLHRGKLALRHIFANELRDEVAVYGLGIADNEGWLQTRIWCPFCGRQKLTSAINRESGEASFCCPDCTNIGRLGIAHTGIPEIIEGVNSYKAILSRQITWLNCYYRNALSTLSATCYRCNSPATVQLHLAPNVHVELKQLNGLHFKCVACDWSDSNPLRYLAFDLPKTQQFWRVHPRMQVLPDREIVYAGRPALLTTFASLGDSSRLDVISASDSFAVLDVVETHR